MDPKTSDALGVAVHTSKKAKKNWARGHISILYNRKFVNIINRALINSNKSMDEKFNSKYMPSLHPCGCELNFVVRENRGQWAWTFPYRKNREMNKTCSGFHIHEILLFNDTMIVPISPSLSSSAINLFHSFPQEKSKCDKVSLPAFFGLEQWQSEYPLRYLKSSENYRGEAITCF